MATLTQTLSTLALVTLCAGCPDAGSAPTDDHTDAPSTRPALEIEQPPSAPSMRSFWSSDSGRPSKVYDDAIVADEPSVITTLQWRGVYIDDEDSVDTPAADATGFVIDIVRTDDLDSSVIGGARSLSDFEETFVLADITPRGRHFAVYDYEVDLDEPIEVPEGSYSILIQAQAPGGTTVAWCWWSTGDGVVGESEQQLPDGSFVTVRGDRSLITF